MHAEYQLGLSDRQREILAIIEIGNSDGSKIDLDQIIDRIYGNVTKGNVQHTLRALRNRKLIERDGQEVRRKRRRALYGLTRLGRESLAEVETILMIEQVRDRLGDSV